MDKSISAYLDFLLEMNQQINLVSRRITREQLEILVNETTRMAKFITRKRIIDAGSGNGILGIVLAMLYPDRQVILLESIKKKTNFLSEAAIHLKCSNVEVQNTRLEDFRFPDSAAENTLVARGFPSLQALAGPLISGVVGEVVTITSLKKIENLKIPLEKVSRTIYNVPFRDVIKILKMENVSRETINR